MVVLCGGVTALLYPATGNLSPREPTPPCQYAASPRASAPHVSAARRTEAARNRSGLAKRVASGIGIRQKQFLALLCARYRQF